MSASDARRVPYRDPGEPDSRGPLRYLCWLVIRQRGRVCLGAMWGSLWMLGLMLQPYFLNRAIDDGLRPHNSSALLVWVGAILAIGAVNGLTGLMRHRTMTRIRTDGALRTVQVVSRHMVKLGATLPKKVTAGELTSVQAADLNRIAESLTMTGPGVGALVTYFATAVVLIAISVPLALVVVLGVPLLMMILLPLMRRLRTVESAYRDQQGHLTARAGDIVAGLRVLGGIGGKDRFAARYRHRSRALLADGYRVGEVESWFEAISSCLAVILLVAVVWVSAHLTAAGVLTVGEMVAVYGYVAALVVPVWFFLGGIDDITRGLVAAQRVVRILRISPEVTDADELAEIPGEPAALRDPDSGLVLRPGRMAALVSAAPTQATDLVDRLGRYVDSTATLGGRPLAQLPLADVRRHILVADNDAYLFAGSLRETVTAHTGRSDADLNRALWTANADDIVDGLPDGLDTPLPAQARTLSGGQRQRLRLARALLAEPAVLVLVEPTSAVDAHTEATIARRIRDARVGRTTLVVSTSPLVLDQTDEVIYLVDGRVAAVDTHQALIAAEPGYRALVFRGDDEEDEPTPDRLQKVSR